MNLVTVTVPVPGALAPNEDEGQLLADVLAGKHTAAILAAVPAAIASGSVQVEILQPADLGVGQFLPPGYAAA